MEKESPEKLSEYDAAIASALIKSPNLMAFADHNSLGKLLVQYDVFTHPALREKLDLEKKQANVAAVFQQLNLADSPEKAAIMAAQEPDFQPKTEDQIILDCSLDKAIMKVVINAVYSDHFENLAKHDFQKEFESEMSNLRGSTRLNALRAAFPEQLAERIYIFIRDHFLMATIKGDYGQIFRIIKIMRPAPTWAEGLAQTINLLKPALFQDPAFRKIATQELVATLVMRGEAIFLELAEYLQSFGLSLEKDCPTHCSPRFVSTCLETLWKRDPHRYYQVIDILLECQLVTAETLTKDVKITLRTFEFVLYSFKNGKFRKSLSDSLPIISEKLHMMSLEDMDPARDRVLWTKYLIVCQGFNHSPDQELLSLYRQGYISRYNGQDE